MTAPTLFGGEESLRLQQTPHESAALREPAYAATTSLYRKHRPQSFASAELVGQQHAVTVLRNAILLDRVAHAYLFSGPRGTGKTTTARVLAKAVNCLSEDPGARPCNVCPNCVAINAGASPDVVEIDAASNRGIDDIRDLRERVRYAPAQLPSKFYIIDEAHQITGAAANAFLKTLEEPPGHARFILATTDPEELLPTIVSRCQHLEFRRIGAGDMVGRLRTVADIEGIAVADDGLRAIARHATGSLRDALGLLEQLAVSAPRAEAGSQAHRIDVADVQAALGLSRNDRVEGLAEAISRHAAGDALRIVGEAIDAGEDPRQLNRQLVRYFRQLLLERSGASADADDSGRELAASFTLEELAALARRFSEIDFSIKHAPYPQLPLEVALVEAITGPESSHQRPSLRPVPTMDESASPQRTTSLRERVRGSSTIPETSRSDTLVHDRSAGIPVTPVTPIRPVGGQTSESSQRPTAIGTGDVERVVELWPRVRADVKALNRRIEALLSEVDPVDVSGNAITLAVPYPFHRDKLNTDEVRETLSGVLSRLLGHDVRLNCILRGELPGPVNVNSTREVASPQGIDGANADDPDSSADRDQILLRAAINIFDAEVLDTPIAPAGQPQSDES